MPQISTIKDRNADKRPNVQFSCRKSVFMLESVSCMVCIVTAALVISILFNHKLANGCLLPLAGPQQRRATPINLKVCQRLTE